VVKPYSRNIRAWHGLDGEGGEVLMTRYQISVYLSIWNSIRKNMIWKSLSISCGFPKNRKFQVTTANFLEGLEIVQLFS